jgi:hypothetical protein
MELPTTRPGILDAGLSLTIFMMIGYLLKTERMVTPQVFVLQNQQVRGVKTTKIETQGVMQAWYRRLVTGQRRTQASLRLNSPQSTCNASDADAAQTIVLFYAPKSKCMT